jgi:hypothetical protein
MSASHARHRYHGAAFNDEHAADVMTLLGESGGVDWYWAREINASHAAKIETGFAKSFHTYAERSGLFSAFAHSRSLVRGERTEHGRPDDVDVARLFK